LKDNTAQIELISPILAHRETDETWSLDVKRIFYALEQRGGVYTNDSCGTHIHLSPEIDSWKLEDLQKLCCCILYFERAFEVLYPESRGQRAAYEAAAKAYWRARYAKANWTDNPKLAKLPYEQCVEQIMGVKTIRELRHLMNPYVPEENESDEAEDGQRRDHQYYARRGQRLEEEDLNDRYYAWNFDNLRDRGKRTVEYRRPPGVKTENACLAWVTLTIKFVKAAVEVDNVYSPLGVNQAHDPENVHVSHLREFLARPNRAGPSIETEDTYWQILSQKSGNVPVLPCSMRDLKPE
jgi:hypothetical protein